MKSLFIRNALVFITLLIPWFVIDYMYIKSGQGRQGIWYESWIHYLCLAAVPLGFYFASARYFSQRKTITRYLYPAAVSILLSVLWGFAAVLFVVTCHFYLGGKF